MFCYVLYGMLNLKNLLKISGEFLKSKKNLKSKTKYSIFLIKISRGSLGISHDNYLMKKKIPRAYQGNF